VVRRGTEPCKEGDNAEQEHAEWSVNIKNVQNDGGATGSSITSTDAPTDAPTLAPGRVVPVCRCGCKESREDASNKTDGPAELHNQASRGCAVRGREQLAIADLSYGTCEQEARRRQGRICFYAPLLSAQQELDVHFSEVVVV